MRYVVTANGKSREIEAETAEMAVRKEMNWYAKDTVFTVNNENGNVTKFTKSELSQSTRGYT